MKDNFENARSGRSQDVVQQALLQRLKAGIGFRKMLISDEFRRAMYKRQGTKYIKNPAVGMQVDFWRQKQKKDEGGYQGPATITDIDANMVTLRWHGQQISASRDQLREHRGAILFTDLLMADHVSDNAHVFITILDNDPKLHCNPTTAETTSTNLDHGPIGTTINTSNNLHHDAIATTSEEAQLTTTHETIMTTMPSTIATTPVYVDNFLTYEVVVYMAQKNVQRSIPTASWDHASRRPA